MIYTCYQERQQENGEAMSERKKVLLRLDPALHDALAGWGADELRSTNAQIEFLLRRATAAAGRLPGPAPPVPARASQPAPPALASGLPADQVQRLSQPPAGQIADLPGGQVQ
jgi:hypothetical protein